MQFTGNLLSDLRYGVSKRWSAYTTGLLARDSSGSGEWTADRWKRFAPKTATLIVDFDSYPGRPSSLSTATVGCGSNRLLLGTTTPVLKAKFHDADTTQKLTGYFEWLEIPADGSYDSSTPRKGTPTHSGMTDGQYGSVTLSSGVQDGHAYAWRVRAKDPYGKYSSWSSWCEFSVDTTKPAAPTGASTDYPDDDAPHGGPGVSGSFTITPADSDVATIRYGWSTPPGRSVSTSSGAAKTVRVTPPRYGDNVLYLQAVDGAGNTSVIGSYNFTVGRPSGPVAAWGLEKRPDVSTGPLTNQVTGGESLTGTGLSWQSGARIPGADTASFDGATSKAETTGPVVDTSKSFSFAAWVRLTDVSGWRTVVAADGTTMSSFRLQYRTTAGAWCMTARDADAADGVITDACGVAPVAGRWTHLVGVYDQAEGEIRLYVDGTLAATNSFSAGWKATGPLTVGRAKNNGSDADHFPGQIADVRVYDRVVVPEDITVGSNDLPALMQPVEVSDWSFDFDCCGQAADSSGWNHGLSLSPSTSFTDDDNGGYALGLDGTSGQATTTGPAVRTDQSFSVAARVRMDASTTVNQTAVAGAGNVISAFYLGFRPSDGAPTWSFSMPDADADHGTTWRDADAPTTVELGTWVQLVGVYNAAAGTISLYVDGDLVATASCPSSWNATGPVIVGAAQWADVGQTPAMTDYFHGAVDDVRLFAGALTDAQATAMAGG